MKIPKEYAFDLIQIFDGRSFHGFFLWGLKKDSYENNHVLVDKGKLLVFEKKNTAVDYFLNGIGNAVNFTSFKFRDRIKRNLSAYIAKGRTYDLDLIALKDIAAGKDIDTTNSEYLSAINMMDDILCTFKNITSPYATNPAGEELKETALELFESRCLPADYYDPHSNFRQRLASQIRFCLRFMKARTHFISG